MGRQTIRCSLALTLLCGLPWLALSQTTNGDTTLQSDAAALCAGAAPAVPAAGSAPDEAADSGLPAFPPVDLAAYTSLSAADRDSLQRAWQAGVDTAMARIAAAHDASVQAAVTEAVAAAVRVYRPREHALCAALVALSGDVDRVQREQIAGLQRQLAEQRIVNGLATAGTALASFFLGHELGSR